MCPVRTFTYLSGRSFNNLRIRWVMRVKKVYIVRAGCRPGMETPTKRWRRLNSQLPLVLATTLLRV